MPAFILYPLSFIVVLGIMIVVHEWGHFAAAKLLGVRVETFSVGFGPRLFGFRRGDTDYRISAIPLGGYVKMSGENPMDERSGDPAEFLSHPRWHRFLIAIAGPFMNIVLAVAMLTGIYMFHYSRPAYLDEPAVIGWVDDSSPAAKAGIKPGDRIVQLDELQNPTWEQVFYKEMLSPNQKLPVSVQRGTENISTSVVPDAVGLDKYGDAGWSPDDPVVITALEGGMPAAKAGAKLGDEVVSIDGVAVRSLRGMIKYLQTTNGKPVELLAQRNGQPIKLQMVPVMTPVEGAKESRYRLGIASRREKIEKLAFPLAFKKSLQDNRKNSFLALELIQKLIRAKVSIKQIEGPIRIGQAAGDAVQEGVQDRGWTPLLQLMAAISLQLGVFNLLPIPILDGGVILLLLIESLMRREISLVIKERVYQTAFVFLLIFASVVIFNDISKVLPHAMQ